jgi:hypothetical protein
MVPFAVSIARTAATNFCWIYPRDTINPAFSRPRSYPHFSAVPCVWDYLTNTIKVSMIPQDSIHRQYVTNGVFSVDIIWLLSLSWFLLFFFQEHFCYTQRISHNTTGKAGSLDLGAAQSR